MRVVRIDGHDYPWGTRGRRVVLKLPGGGRRELDPADLTPPHGDLLSSIDEVCDRHVRWFLLAKVLHQPERAEREARRHSRRLRKSRRRHAPPPPERVVRDLRDVHVVIAERGTGARYSWDLVAVYDDAERARALARTRNRAAYDALRAGDPLMPEARDGDLYDILERRDPHGWRLRVERRMANRDPLCGQDRLPAAFACA